MNLSATELKKMIVESPTAHVSASEDYRANTKKMYLLTAKTKLSHKLMSESIKEPHLYLNKPLKEAHMADILYPDLESKILVTDRICHTLKAGKIYRFRVTLAVGNRKGVIGLGIGKHKFKDKAIVKAVDQAKKNIIYLKSFEADMGLQDTSKNLDSDSELGTYYGPRRVTSYKLSGTEIEVCPLLSDSVTASKLGREYCQLAGFKRIKISLKKKNKVDSKMNYYKALHAAIKAQAQDEQNTP